MTWNTLHLAIREIWRNIFRSALTILGIVIGVAAVIIMVTLGRGATEKVSAGISSLGSNQLHVRPGAGSRGPGGVSSTGKSFDDDDIESIRQEVLGISFLTPISSQMVLAVYGNQNWSTILTGTDNDFFNVREWPIAKGRQFSENELRAGKLVCIIGATIATELFGNEDPLDASIRLGKVSCNIIGILDTKGQSTFGQNQDDTIVIPIKAFQRRIAGNRDIAAIYIAVQNGDVIKKVKNDIERLMRQRRNIGENDEDDFNVLDMQEIVERVISTTETLTALLGAVAAVSLLVGGIGIMNIMLVSVTERTREIGVRLAIGALESDVLRQFLLEAIVLSTFGGIMGIIIGLIGSASLAPLMGLPFIFDVEIIVIAFIFSSMVGVVFGYFPARKAARLNPIDALRHE